MSNDANDVLRYHYASYLEEAEGKDSKTVDEAMRALSEFEVWSQYADFVRLNRDQIVAFKEHLVSRPSKASGHSLSATSITHILRHLKDFFTWLSEEPEGRKITSSIVQYFTPKRSIRAAARTSEPRYVAPIEDWIRVLECCPSDSLIELRDRAVIGLLILTGARDAAIVSLRRKHIDLVSDRLNQDGTEVDTKFGKSMWTWFFPVPGIAREAVRDWVRKLDELGFGSDDPLFPRSVDGLALGVAQGAVIPAFWETTGPVRRLLSEACARAGVSYFVPHSVRNTLARLGVDVCLTLKEFRAWSQNLGHNSMWTTLEHYARLKPDEIGEVLRKLAKRGDDHEEAHFLELWYAAEPKMRELAIQVLKA